LEKLLPPLLYRIGDEWVAGNLNPAQEHLATGVLEGVLAWLTDPIASVAVGTVVVAATLPGERHGLGARLAAGAAALAGCRVVYLGVDLPVEDIVAAADAVDASAVAVSIVNAERRAAVLGHLAELRDELSPGVRVLVGGAGASTLGRGALPAGVELVADLAGLREALGGSRSAT
jgi:methanogenic corrinoid protein MtbC1